MKLEHGKRYNTLGAGIGTAERHPKFYDVTLLFFNDDSPKLPIYYYDEDEGRSNVSHISTKYDVISEVTEKN